MSGKETVEFAREAMLVQLQLQLESLMSIAKNCRDTVHRLRGMLPPAASPEASPSRGRPRLVTDQVLEGMPAAIRPMLTAVLTSPGTVAVTAPWLNPEEYAAVCEVVLAMGGSRIVAGKLSRWEVPVPADAEAEAR